MCLLADFMPTTLLISKVCPDGVETTTFAMLAGIAVRFQSKHYVSAKLCVCDAKFAASLSRTLAGRSPRTSAHCFLDPLDLRALTESVMLVAAHLSMQALTTSVLLAVTILAACGG